MVLMTICDQVTRMVQTYLLLAHGHSTSLPSSLPTPIQPRPRWTPATICRNVVHGMVRMTAYNHPCTGSDERRRHDTSQDHMVTWMTYFGARVAIQCSALMSFARAETLSLKWARNSLGAALSVGLLGCWTPLSPVPERIVDPKPSCQAAYDHDHQVDVHQHGLDVSLQLKAAAAPRAATQRHHAAASGLPGRCLRTKTSLQGSRPNTITAASYLAVPEGVQGDRPLETGHLQAFHDQKR